MYKALIGLEMHCEISETKTKVFSSAVNGYSDIPNSNIRPVDMAFPGTLPVVNKEAVRKAVMASIILKCKQPEYMYFERKNYYYPDLPKGFQITQETKPAPVGIYGHLDFECNGKKITAKINNLHLEEDAASMVHEGGISRIDYNRAGTPLLELVTEPCFHSSDEAVAFLEAMRSIYQFSGISEADTTKGQIRCDVNVSIMDASLDESDPKNWGTKIEVKNVNSFGGVKNAIDYEIERQTSLKESGEYDDMIQQTRRWDEDSESTIFMRSKVDAIDYKYFIEPNIPKVKLSKEWIKEISESIPMLASERKEIYLNEYHLPEYDTNIILKSIDTATYFEKVINLGTDPKEASNWLITRILGYLNKEEKTIKDVLMTPEMLHELISLIDKKTISSNQAKKVFDESISTGKKPSDIVKEKGLMQITDKEEIRKYALEVLDENPDLIEKYKNGKTNLFDYMVGQIMKKTRGKANPSLAREVMQEEVNKR